MIIFISFIKSNYYIGGKDWYISFHYSIDMLETIKDFIENVTEIWVTTGPGSFISNRSILAFLKGIVIIKKSIKLYNYNILNLIYENKNNHLYFFVELDRFVYYKEENKIYLTYLDKFIQHLKKINKISIGNHIIAQKFIDINFFFLFSLIENKKSYLKSSTNIEYCDKFIDN
ncbi:hypothetical protein AB836_00985 [Rickettsiales bacterium (ex Bugula neritina AB1)]|nr:hypothetical protein AB836_00985 [Rickettsiales bacterium (ex Bugula neritina AB1)]